MTSARLTRPIKTRHQIFFRDDSLQMHVFVHDGQTADIQVNDAGQRLIETGFRSNGDDSVLDDINGSFGIRLHKSGTDLGGQCA